MSSDDEISMKSIIDKLKIIAYGTDDEQNVELPILDAKEAKICGDYIIEKSAKLPDKELIDIKNKLDTVLAKIPMTQKDIELKEELDAKEKEYTKEYDRIQKIRKSLLITKRMTEKLEAMGIDPVKPSKDIKLPELPRIGDYI